VQTDESGPGTGPVNEDSSLTRGAFLKRGVAGAAALGAAPLLIAACGGGSSAGPGTTHTSAASGPVRRGGQLRVGLVGGGTAETLNPYLAITPIDQARIQNLYDPLVLVNSDMSQSPGLALEWNPNKDATSWEVKLRPDVTFWNGKTFDSKDVLYSIGLMAAKTSAGAPFVSGINLHEMKAVNKYLVRIPLKFPDADLSANFTYYNTWMVQDGEKNFTHPVGTGPFELVSFTPGQQSIFKRNPNYWVSGKPYVDQLKYISISDPTARLNALLSGQIDAMAQLPYQDAKAHQSVGDINVLSAKSPQPYMFYMDTTRAPFNDNNVRQAMRLIADRPALIESAISGYGTLGNDIVGKGLEFFDTSIPQRVQDIDKAKSLLKSAGQQNLTVELQTSPIFPGFVEAATLLAQQATAAGVKINLKQEPASSYYNPSILYLKMAFAQTQWAVPSIKFFYLQSLAANAPYNETHWKSASFNNLLFKAIGELDKNKAQQLWNQVQQIQWNEGGYLLWTNADWVDGLSTKVRGLEPSAASALGNYLFRNVWLAS
jgi:peptide/nickel transport system substrate-binding protein